MSARLGAMLTAWPLAVCCPKLVDVMVSMRTLYATFVPLALLVAGSTATAQDDAAAGGAFQVHPLTGPAVRGRVTALDAKGVSFGEKRLDFEDLWFFHGPAPALQASGLVEVRLATGERLVGDVLGGDVDGNGLTLRTPSYGPIEIALDDVVLLRVRGEEGFPDAARFARASGAAAGETVYKETPLGFDPVRGVLEYVETKGVHFEVDGGGSELFTWNRIAGMTLPRLVPKYGPSGARIVLLTSDGSRLHVRGKSMDGSTLVFAHERFGDLRVEPERILAGHVEDEATRIMVSKLSPTRVDERDLFSEKALYSWERDANVLGGPLCVGRSYFTSGIGAHALSRLEFEVPEGATSLRTWFGADDIAIANSRIGDMSFRILRGDEVLAEAKNVRGGRNAEPFPPLAVVAGQRVVFEIGFGAALHTLDRGDWLVPVFVR
ncbi:MAG: NPCBM/NEW2 domain-containing protein [Planctomycetes bacterium]|nr:NPCBM/NEW2 domain-containing protein [Planctomycetota bacterium]MCB9918858.1 NPCBM/NEW2 domain-containing protein [Planctomycetota bacterium]